MSTLSKRLHRVWQAGLKCVDSDDCGQPSITTGTENYRTRLPPKVVAFEIIGHLTDDMGKDHIRTNGRSSTVGGHAYFCLNNTTGDDASDRATGVPHTSVAIVENPDTDPIVCDTFSKEQHGVTKPFMPMTELEAIYEAETGDATLISLPGGICEGTKKTGQAYVWYQKWIRGKDKNGNTVEIYNGTGIGSVTVDPETGNIAGRRLHRDRILFRRSDPAFGTFSVVENGNWFYVWGKQGEHIYLARVAKWTPTQAELYEFWDGYEFTAHMRMVAPVFSGYSHGTVFRTNMFGDSYSWAFIGLSERGERTVDIGLAAEVWGPYKMSEILTPKMLPPNHEMTSCLFVHDWAFREHEGQTMITWNDGKSGKIIAARLQFAMLHMGTYWREISLSKMPSVFSGLAHGRKAMIEAIARQKRVYSEVETKKDGRAVIRLMGNTPLIVSEITDKVCELISNWKDEITADDLNTKLRAKKLI